MWIVAGVLLGAVLVLAVAGFHAGPHIHVAAGAVGAVAAAWLLVMAATGRAAAVVWPLLAVDVAVSGAAAVSGWWGRRQHTGLTVRAIEGSEGVAVGDLRPAGIVRVRGEDWTAESVNGHVRAGTRVQVLRADGVRLQVWGEEVEVTGRGGEAGPAGGQLG